MYDRCSVTNVEHFELDLRVVPDVVFGVFVLRLLMLCSLGMMTWKSVYLDDRISCV